MLDGQALECGRRTWNCYFWCFWCRLDTYMKVESIRSAKCDESLFSVRWPLPRVHCLRSNVMGGDLPTSQATGRLYAKTRAKPGIALTMNVVMHVRRCLFARRAHSQHAFYFFDHEKNDAACPSAEDLSFCIPRPLPAAPTPPGSMAAHKNGSHPPMVMGLVIC